MKRGCCTCNSPFMTFSLQPFARLSHCGTSLFPPAVSRYFERDPVLPDRPSGKNGECSSHVHSHIAAECFKFFFQFRIHTDIYIYGCHSHQPLYT